MHAEERVEISGGHVTLTVDLDFFKASDEDIELALALRRLIRDYRHYRRMHPEAAS